VRALPANWRDRVTGAILLAVALVWIVLVYTTIDPAEGTEAGPRAFPLFFGVLLAVLSVVLLVQTFLSEPVDDAAEEEQRTPGEFVAVVMTIGSLAVYGMLLQPLGFIVSTAIVAAAMMIVVLRITSPLTVAAMSLGLSLGCYIVFGKLLGTYLPPGTIVSIYF
jgi:hypothetical protein